MKKFFLSALSALLTVSAVDAQTVQRTPFIEHFTQASCAPCASQNPIMYNTLNTFGTSNYVKMTYQTSWPGTDPMNAAYPAGPQARVTYYSVTGVPDASLNGGATDAPNTAVTASKLSAAAALTTPYDVKVTHTWNAGAFDVRVAVVNVSNAPISSMNRLHLGMVENQISYPTAPGSNGETSFFYVLRQFYNASTGMPSNAPATIGAIPANDSIVYTFSVSNYPSYINDLEQVSFVAFVQNNSTKVVEQADKSALSSIPGIVYASAAANSTVGAGYCDYSFTPSVNFTSNSTTPITTVTAEYTVNGGTAVPITLSGLSLTSGQSTPITFPATTLPSTGNSSVQYTITDINNGGTYSPGAVSMSLETYSKLPSTSSATPIVEGFQGLATGTPSPTGAIADNPTEVTAVAISSAAVSSVTWNLGGHGASNGCFIWDFYSITNGRGSKLIWNKLDLTTKVNSRVSFSRAHALYSGTEPDRLKVNVSTDCGTTWTTVWDKQGTQLATVPPVGNNTRYYAAVGDWVTDTVDLTAYDGQSEVVIAFEAISGYGNSLFIDDVNTFEATVVGVSAINTEAAEVRIMPNPVSTQMTLEFTLLNTVDANISIINALGQQVQQVTNGSFSGTNVIEVNTSELTSGVYFVNIITEEGTTTKRFVRQ
jgi:hypothetical protein